MTSELEQQKISNINDELNRLLEIGRILAEVLTESELASLQVLRDEKTLHSFSPSVFISDLEIGNDSVT